MSQSTPQPPRTLVRHKDKLYERRSFPHHEGWTEVHDIVVKEQEPVSRWTGDRIPFALWEQITAFMRWSQKTHNSEALITLFYNVEEQDPDKPLWCAWPFIQHPSGMTVTYDTRDPLYAEDRKKFGRAWVEMGTVHHHCRANAFASSTDQNDETGRDGFHVTLGQMDQDRLDTHFRQTLDGITTMCTPVDWIEIPEWVAEKVPHQALIVPLFLDLLRFCGNAQQDAFPEEWKSRIVPFTRNDGRTILTDGFGSITGFPRKNKFRPQHSLKIRAATSRFSEPRYPGDPKRERAHKIDLLRGICRSLGLKAEEAYRLYCGHTRSMDLLEITNECRELRSALFTRISDKGLDWLTLRDMFDELVDQECGIKKEGGSTEKEIVV